VGKYRIGRISESSALIWSLKSLQHYAPQAEVWKERLEWNWNEEGISFLKCRKSKLSCTWGWSNLKRNIITPYTNQGRRPIHELQTESVTKIPLSHMQASQVFFFAPPIKKLYYVSGLPSSSPDFSSETLKSTTFDPQFANFSVTREAGKHKSQRRGENE
jgi:hypothetical protein